MTREEQKRYKELNKYLDNKTKEIFKAYSLKKKDYMFYISKNDMFYSVMFSMTKPQNTVKVYFYAKPLWLDDILWDILDMSSNKKAPISLRSVGAFTINSQIDEKEYPFENEEDIDRIADSAFKNIISLANAYTEDDFFKDYNSISYQSEMIHTIVLIYNEEYETALNFLKNTEIRNFITNNKCFSELAIEYINNIK